MLSTLVFYAQTINILFASAGLAVLAFTIVLAYDYKNGQKIYKKIVAPHIWYILALTTIGGVATTLLYSEVLGFIPCSLCWLQRVALYPQAILVLVAWRMKDAVFLPVYGLALSGFGFLVAVYHFIYQNLPQKSLQSGITPCLADGSADCSEKIMEVFGFVTFPFLSAVLFLFLIVLFLHLKKSQK